MQKTGAEQNTKQINAYFHIQFLNLISPILLSIHDLLDHSIIIIIAQSFNSQFQKTQIYSSEVSGVFPGKIKYKNEKKVKKKKLKTN